MEPKKITLACADNGARLNWFIETTRDLLARGLTANEIHQLVVLDEVTYPINWGWIAVDDVVATLRDRPGRQHVVITGRRADPRLVEAADLVTEMAQVKHPMEAGQKGQRGIEW